MRRLPNVGCQKESGHGKDNPGHKHSTTVVTLRCCCALFLQQIKHPTIRKFPQIHMTCRTYEPSPCALPKQILSSMRPANKMRGMWVSHIPGLQIRCGSVSWWSSNKSGKRIITPSAPSFTKGVTREAGPGVGGGTSLGVKEAAECPASKAAMP